MACHLRPKSKPYARHCAACGVEFCPMPGKGAWRRKHCTPQCRKAAAYSAADQRQGERTAICEACGQSFSYTSRGKERRWCSRFECRKTRLRTLAGGIPLCIVQGCRNLKQYDSGLCNSCYYRQRRTGTTAPPVYAYRSMHSSGYVCLQEPSHPLAVNGSVFEHRKVLFEAIGPGHHPCHWCQTPVEWMRKGTAKRCTLVVDHLDADKANNALENLVPSCSRCNWSRGLMMAWVFKHKDDPVLWRMYESARQRTA